MASYRDVLPAIVIVDDPPRKTRYRLIQQVGEGGMAKVYLAEILDVTDEALKAHNRSRQCAIKFPRAEMLENESVAMRFLEESRLSIRFRHPNILRAYNYGLDQEDMPHIVMEYVASKKTLADIIEWYYDQYYTFRERRDEATGLIRGSLLPKELIVEIMLQIAASVAELHRQGVIHRDQKPDNYLVASENPIHLKLTDFGIAKSFSNERPDLTRGGVVGTPYYLAPEQISPIIKVVDGKKQTWTTDKRSDIWSVGVILYELLTGFHPFFDESSTEKVMLMVRDEDIEATPIEMYVTDPDPELSMLIMDCLVKDPAKRIPTIEEVLRRLTAIKDRLKPDSLPVPVAAVSVPAPVVIPASAPPVSVQRPDSLPAMAQRFVPELVPPPAPAPPVPPPLPALAAKEQDRPSLGGRHSPTAFAETVEAPPPRSGVPMPPRMPERHASPTVRPTVSTVVTRIRRLPPRMKLIFAGAAAAMLAATVATFCSSGEKPDQTADMVLATSSAKAATLSSSGSRVEGPSPSSTEPEPADSVEEEPAPAPGASPLMSSNVPSPQPSAARTAPVQLPRGSNEDRWYRMGARYAMRGNCDAALYWLYRVKAASPQFPETYRYLGDCARRRKKLADARRYYETYLSFEGTTSAVLVKEAQALLGR